jgi:hypothetical protein
VQAVALFEDHLLPSYGENCLFGKTIKDAHDLHRRIVIISSNACDGTSVIWLNPAGGEELQTKVVCPLHILTGQVFQEILRMFVGVQAEIQQKVVIFP